eukprot:NODE_9900_length_1391_cov_8.587816.p1 GENE.NODE_9900_length_1391_cov_8.587816~~NODE_9900_length_1391_cov_8.587816.p1  ORF type:complete len:250 (+),score=48.89 NODE_9900_length_1391_cov_8.587816:415-1164(+)
MRLITLRAWVIRPGAATAQAFVEKLTAPSICGLPTLTISSAPYWTTFGFGMGGGTAESAALCGTALRFGTARGNICGTALKLRVDIANVGRTAPALLADIVDACGRLPENVGEIRLGGERNSVTVFGGGRAHFFATGGAFVTTAGAGAMCSTWGRCGHGGGAAKTRAAAGNGGATYCWGVAYFITVFSMTAGAVGAGITNLTACTGFGGGTACSTTVAAYSTTGACGAAYSTKVGGATYSTTTCVGGTA